MTLRELHTTLSALPATPRVPVLFVGHGSPMNGLEKNIFSRAWETKGAELQKPRAILCISAHWFVPGTFVHTASHPRTIHDFYGFPEKLYALRYPCPGAPDYARETKRSITATNVHDDTEWGIDHGAWIVLRRMFPEADIPTFQLSIDFTKPSRFHYELGRQLRPLRERGVLIIGSGNIVHNLGMIEFNPLAKPFDWALEFDAIARDRVLKADHEPLIAYERFGEAAALSIPTPDHYWPMLYVLGAQHDGEQARFFAEGVTHASISMRAFEIS